MTMKTKIAATCAAAAMTVTMGAANAQMNAMTPMSSGAPMMPATTSSAMMPRGGMAPGGSAMMPGSSMTTSQTSQTVSTGDAYGADSYASDSGTLPNTGGEPLLMMMAGTLLAGSAFALRRKLS